MEMYPENLQPGATRRLGVHVLPVWGVKTIGKKGIPGRTPAQMPIRGSRGLRQGRPDIGISKLGALGNHRHLGSQGAEALAELSRGGQKGICKGDPQQIGMDPYGVLGWLL